MLLFAKIAWRNVTRNLRRTLITLAAIACGLASVVVFFGFTDGFHAQWIENSVKIYSGHISIFAQHYRDEFNLNRSISDVDFVTRVAAEQNSLAAFTTRVHVSGLPSTAESSTTVLIRGIDTRRENSITELDQRIIDGEFLEAEGKRGILLGHSLAKRLNAELGDKVVLMVQASDGSIGAELFRLRGIFRLGSVDLDQLLAVISIRDAQELAVLGGKVTETVLIIDSPDKVLPVANQLNEQLLPAGYQAQTWQELLPQAKEMIDLSRVFLYVILLIVLVVVALGILNTMLMSIMERTREFGIMMALGTRPTQIVSLVMLESTFLGVVGVTLGILIGTSINASFAIRGFDLTNFAGAMDLMSSLSPIIYPKTDPGNVALASVAAFVTTLLVSIYPAVRAARLIPVVAIRSI